MDAKILLFLIAYLLLIIVILFFYLLYKIRQLQITRKKAKKLEKELQILDNEARLIIQTDFELKNLQDTIRNIQEAISSLTLLLKRIKNIADEKEIFTHVNETFILSLGTDKFIILNEKFETELNINFTEEQIDTIKKNVQELYQKGNKNTIIEKIERETGLKDIIFYALEIKPTKIWFTLFHKRRDKLGNQTRNNIIQILFLFFYKTLENLVIFEELYRSKQISEDRIKAHTNELIKSLREIEKLSKLKSDFVSRVSHELRTPLTSIKGYSSLLVAGKFGHLPEEAKTRLKKIDENVDKLVEMVNTLLDITKIEAKKIETKFAKYNLVSIIKETVDLFVPQSQEKRIQLITETPQEMPVFVDKSLIERVFINLINNAIKFTPEEGKITIGCQKEKDKVLVFVRDSGYGMTKEEQEKVFEEFFRADNPINRKEKGTGLGLSLVKRIIEIHNGNIWVDSLKNKGTTFYFTLPFKND